MSDIQRSYSPNWVGVVELIDDWSRKNADDFLMVLGKKLSGLVEDHYNSQDGCSACSGEIEDCAPWADAQDIMLAWLISKVDL